MKTTFIIILAVAGIFAANIFLGKSSVQETDSQTSKIESKDKNLSSKTQKTSTLNIRRINSRLVNAQSNDRDDALKEFLIAKKVFDGNRSIDISEIKTLTFEQLNNAELITVSYLPNLIELNISGTLVNNIDCLANLQNLQHLNISGTSLENLNSLKELKLKTLIMSDTQTDHYHILGMIKSLQYLDISNCNIKEIKQLQSLENLVHLDLSNTEISDLSPVSDLPKLKKVNYSGSAVVHNSENAELILRTR